MLTNDSQINFYDILQCYSLAQKTFDFFSVRLRNFFKKITPTGIFRYWT